MLLDVTKYLNLEAVDEKGTNLSIPLQLSKNACNYLILPYKTNVCF